MRKFLAKLIINFVSCCRWSVLKSDEEQVLQFLCPGKSKSILHINRTRESLVMQCSIYYN